MPLTKRPDARIVPEYSLTGDILSYLRCPQQYRRYNLGKLPPSKPVQLWFGEFIHGVMEESCRQYKDGKIELPVSDSGWPDFKKSVIDLIVSSLMARGLQPYRTQYVPNPQSASSTPRIHDYGIAALRAFKSVNLWGTHLFPLVKFAEVRIKGTRSLHEQVSFRSNRYQIQGVVDVVSAMTIDDLPKDNLLCDYVLKDCRIQEVLKVRQEEIVKAGGFEVIIDYKGMRRPPNRKDGEINEGWNHYLWQIQTYAWLRERMADAKPVIAGILLFLNELVPSKTDLQYLQAETNKKKHPDTACIFETDIAAEGNDLNTIKNFKYSEVESSPILSKKLRLDRSILISPIIKDEVIKSAQKFDGVVGKIESCVNQEVETGRIIESWGALPEKDTCTACDFNRICKMAIA